MVVCVDANGKVGEAQSCTIGDQSPDSENANGEAMHSMLSALPLADPSTMVGHAAVDQHTWQDTAGGRHRIDYI